MGVRMAASVRTHGKMPWLLQLPDVAVEGHLTAVSGCGEASC